MSREVKGVILLVGPSSGIGCLGWLGIGMLVVVLIIGAFAMEIATKAYRAIFTPSAPVSFVAFGTDAYWTSDNEISFEREKMPSSPKDPVQKLHFTINTDGTNLQQWSVSDYDDWVWFHENQCQGVDVVSDNGVAAYCVVKPGDGNDEVWLSDSSGDNARFLAYQNCRNLIWSPNQQNLLCFAYPETYEESARDNTYVGDGRISIIWGAGNR